LPAVPHQGTALRRRAADLPVHVRPTKHGAAALGTAGTIALLTSLATGCGVSSVSGVALESPASCASVFPSPGTQTASTKTQISVRGVKSASMMSAQVGVAGSQSGHHTGLWVEDSDGRGASFYPIKPFTAGETVTVTLGVPICGAEQGTMTFTVAHPPGPLAPGATPTTAPARAPLDQPTLTYASRPDLRIPKLAVKVPGHFGGQ
jgi:hypothetical protein